MVSKGETDRYLDDRWDVTYDPSDKKFHDIGYDVPNKWGQDNTGTNLSDFPTDPNMPIHYWYYDGSLRFVFDNPFYVAPPVPEPDESQKRLVGTGGGWTGAFEWLYFETTSEGRYLYGLVNKDTTTRYSPADYDVEYEPSDGKWHDVGTNKPSLWGIDDIGTNLSAFPTAPNMQTQYWYDDGGGFRFQFNNPYYVAPPVDEPDENKKRIVFTDGDWNGLYDYYYMETTAEGRYLYGLVDEGTTNTVSANNFSVEYDPSDGKFYDVGGLDPYKWATDADGTGLSDFPTATNQGIYYLYNSGGDLKCQFENPFYVVPSYRYLAFYGETGVDRPTFQEIELTLGTPLNGSSEIKNGVNDTGITFYESKAWNYVSNYNDYSTIMNGDYNWASPRVQYDDVENINAIFWYIDMGTGVAADVNSGTFWTYDHHSITFTLGKLYGTNTDPATFGDASLIANYEFVCDLNRQTA